MAYPEFRQGAKSFPFRSSLFPFLFPPLPSYPFPFPLFLSQVVSAELSTDGCPEYHTGKIVQIQHAIWCILVLLATKFIALHFPLSWTFYVSAEGGYSRCPYPKCTTAVNNLHTVSATFQQYYYETKLSKTSLPIQCNLIWTSYFATLINSTRNV